MKNMRKILSIMTVMLLLASGMTTYAKTYLVSAGISDYPGKKNDLRLPAKDAKTIDWLFNNHGDCETILLLNSKATASNISHAMDSLFAKAGADDVVIFYFSGHGTPGTFRAYDKGLPYSAVTKALSRSKGKSKIIFADACYSGRIGNSKTKINTTDEESAAKSAEVMLFLSSRKDEPSIERPSMANGIFTTYLQKGLRGDADKNRDRVITARELYEYVHSGVIENSRDKQHPVMWGKFSDDMPILKW